MKKRNKRPVQLRTALNTSYSEVELNVLYLVSCIPPDNFKGWTANAVGFNLWGGHLHGLPASAILRRLQAQDLLTCLGGSPLQWTITEKGKALLK